VRVARGSVRGHLSERATAKECEMSESEEGDSPQESRHQFACDMLQNRLLESCNGLQAFQQLLGHLAFLCEMNAQIHNYNKRINGWKKRGLEKETSRLISKRGKN
jgi:hypothetical protein